MTHGGVRDVAQTRLIARHFQVPLLLFSKGDGRREADWRSIGAPGFSQANSIGLRRARDAGSLRDVDEDQKHVGMRAGKGHVNMAMASFWENFAQEITRTQFKQLLGSPVRVSHRTSTVPDINTPRDLSEPVKARWC